MAVAEIMAIISTVNAASAAINKVAGTCNDLSTIGSFVGKLGQAQVDIQAYQNKHRNNMSEEELIQIKLAKKQYQDRMAEIKDLFYWSGNANLWDEIQTEMANARKRRIAEMRAKETARKKAISITIWAGFILIVALAVFLAMLYAISTYAEPLITNTDLSTVLLLLGGLPLW